MDAKDLGAHLRVFNCVLKGCGKELKVFKLMFSNTNVNSRFFKLMFDYINVNSEIAYLKIAVQPPAGARWMVRLSDGDTLRVMCL